MMCLYFLCFLIVVFFYVLAYFIEEFNDNVEIFIWYLWDIYFFVFIYLPDVKYGDPPVRWGPVVPSPPYKPFGLFMSFWSIWYSKFIIYLIVEFILLLCYFIEEIINTSKLFIFTIDDVWVGAQKHSKTPSNACFRYIY